MKKIFSLAIVSFLIVTNSQAKIWRVNNTNGVAADFTNAQAAHNGAAAGDTIHLEPSVNGYGSLTTSKKLTWISTGNFLTNHPGLQYSATPGGIADLAVNAGSENSVFSCNIAYVYCYAPNVTFQRCFIASNFLAIYSTANNCVTIGCFINGSLSVNGATNVIISNNIIAYSIGVSSTSSAVLTNNILNYVSSGGNTIYNSQLQNNIIDQANSNYAFTNCVLNNNMANNTSLPAGNGNVNSVTMSTVFANFSGNTDGDYVLKAASPAIGTGYGGTDMGVFGGSTPFVIAMQPAVPAIYQLTAPAAPSGNTMNVTFSTRSNN
ncbi:MAG: hypothetical protein ABIX01_02385 [Chitinophagaceae bacterium]